MDRRENKQVRYFHFGHEHPLNHTNSPPKENSLCSACKLKIASTGYYYTCKACPFFLHKVCHDMPKKTQHPSHPNHYLTLRISPPPTTKPSAKCEACDDDLIANGYHYGCDECGLCYHILCSALPLSAPVSCHSHELKLTFSPPYSFRCDICNEPSHFGWLYRCRICEFDAHLMCAVGVMIPFHDEVLIMQSAVAERSVKNYDSENNNADSGGKKIRSLLVQSYDHQNSHELKLFDQKESNNYSISPLTLAAISEETTSAAASFQFSDACFSIDLARSYSGYDKAKRGIIGTTTENGRGDSEDRVEGKAIMASYFNNNSDDHEVNLKPTGGFKKHKQVVSSNYYGGHSAHNYSFNRGRDERLREAFLVRNDTLSREELCQIKRKKGKSAFGNQSKEKSGGSSWQKFLICFCYTT